MADRKLTVVLAGDSKGLQKLFGTSSKEAESWGKRLTGATGLATLGLAGVGVGAIAMGKQLFDAAIESAKVTRQTEAVITSMGGASNITADQVAKLSTSLSNKTAVDDEMIQSGENILLTFGKVRNEVGEGNDIFNQATAAALDMSVALGTDMNAASLQVGKALNDPVKGIAALTRAGVSFTQQQKDQVAAMVASGDTLGAQKLIMSELTKQFGGSAASQATGLDRLKVVWGNLQEQLGTKLIPIVEAVTTWMSDKLPGALDTVSRWVSTATDVIGWFADKWDYLKYVVGAAAVLIGGYYLTLGVQAAISAVQQFAAWVVANTAAIAAGVVHAVQFAIVIAGWVAMGVASLLGAAQVALAWLIAMGPIALVIAAVIALVIVIVKNWDTIKEVIGAAWEWVKDVTGKAWDWIKDVFGKALDFVVDLLKNWTLPGLILTHLDDIKRFFSEAWTAVKDFVSDRLDDIVDFVTGMPGRIASAASGMWDGIKDSFKNAVNVIIRFWNGLEFKVPGWDPPGPVGEIGGFTLGMPNIPEFRAMGGPVTGGRSYWVGELGPERFVPSTSGTIIPAGAAAGNTYVFPNFIGSRADLAAELDWHDRARTLAPSGIR